MGPVAKVALAAVLATGAGVGGVALVRGHADKGVGSRCGIAAIPLAIESANGRHDFCVETAKTEAEQQKGLMFRTDIKPDGGMLFAPYPPAGGAPREASFWMKNTPTPLDIVYIRPDGTIAHIAENTVPFSEEPIPSGEPVSAVLEIVGGRAADLGVAEGDRVSWTDATKPPS